MGGQNKVLKFLKSGNVQFFCEKEFQKWVDALEQEDNVRGM